MPSRASRAGTNIQVVAVALRLILRPRIYRLHNKWVAAPQPAFTKILLCELCFILHTDLETQYSLYLPGKEAGNTHWSSRPLSAPAWLKVAAHLAALLLSGFPYGMTDECPNTYHRHTKQHSLPSSGVQAIERNFAHMTSVAKTQACTTPSLSGQARRVIVQFFLGSRASS